MILVVDDDVSLFRTGQQDPESGPVFLSFDPRQLRENFPDLRIIAISGALDEQVVEDAKELGAVEIPHKPITSDWKPIMGRIRATKAR